MGVLTLLGFIGLGAVAGVVAYHSRDLPSVEQLREHYEPPQVSRVLARDGTVLEDIFTERRTVIPVAGLPDHVKLAFLAAEDARFFEHTGVNYWGILRAAVANLRAGRTVQGGSTITQQVVKNVILDSERSYRRKIREAVLAQRLEEELGKEEIFHLYLNHIYFGHGRYGVEEAAQFYFGKGAKDLDLAEAALLAGIVASPGRYTPRRSPEVALARREYVLGQMLSKGFISQEVHDPALGDPLRLAAMSEVHSKLAPEVVSYARTVLKELVGEKADLGGYEITTTIDPALQAQARAAVRENLDTYAKRHKLAPPYRVKGTKAWGKPFAGSPQANRIYVGTVESFDDDAGTLIVAVGDVTGTVSLRNEDRYNPEHLAPSKFAEKGALLRVSLTEAPDESQQARVRLELGPQSALVSLDVASREVRALIGSYEAQTDALDRAMNSKRQPGSVFKAFVYSYALHSRRFNPASVIEFKPKKRRTPKAGEEAPEFERVSLRTAITHSRNEATLEVFKSVGPRQVVRWAEAVGVHSKMEPDLSLPLGAYEVSPIEIVNAYATFASGGQYGPPILITKVVGPDGVEVPLRLLEPRRRVMDEDEAFLTTSLLQSVVQEGTGQRARALGREVAGKTGTTNEARDAWFVGYSTDLATGVWVGFDDNRPLGGQEQGAQTALPAWISFMQAAHEGRPRTSFPVPHGIVTANIDPATGFLAYYGQEDAVGEQFLDGTVPTDAASPPEPEGADEFEAGDELEAGDEFEAGDELEAGDGAPRSSPVDALDSSELLDVPEAPEAPPRSRPEAAGPAAGASSDEAPPPF